ncbi:MAG: hypothetical protein MJZ38_00410 [archaeon]|nr:hypothetical protein [archaeon]
MEIRIDVSLDPTLGCGQAHRWRRLEDGSWQGVVKNHVTTLTQTDNGFICAGGDERDLREYFRDQDDLSAILAEISEADPIVADLAGRCPGLRILKQPEWECLATYLLATNVNVKRIAKMVESVCDLFGTDLGARRAFPTAKQILDGKERISECRLGFREPRLIELAQSVEDGILDIDALKELEYGDLVRSLQTINGVGPKVADCVAIFGFGKLEAFPVDIRIQKCMETMYGVTGSYSRVADFGRKRFGRYAGYAQELLYHSDFI